MPTCEYCDKTIEAGTRRCPYCFAPLDHSEAPQEQPRRPAQQAQRPAVAAAPGTAPRPAGPGGGAQPAPNQPGQPGAPAEQQGGSLEDVVRSLQAGDAGGVARGLQQMAGSGQLDVSKLAGDLGVGGEQSLDLGQVARSLIGGGSQSSQVLGAISRQSGGLGKILGNAASALKSPTGIAVGVGALAAAGVGAGYLIHRARQGGGGGGIGDTLGSLSDSVSDGLSSLLGGKKSEAGDAEVAQYRQIAEQLPPATAAQLKEGTVVLARWDRDEWQPGQIGWVDGGRARVTFENGMERWCDPGDLRLPPTPGSPPQAPPPAPQTDPMAEAPVAQPAPAAYDAPQSPTDDPFAGTDEDPFK